uniref:uncharacterized protein LOC113475028 n=1 Tax=Ciona intestinalis TaxID=7719 RepID=UPI000EF49452|nr:uncharacterized protein LOC113475028 [Ciona intestinalis]|eukprot:XP_026694231.1 uncharacterized protein LOC113475028 [Ciona intestinalis]
MFAVFNNYAGVSWASLPNWFRDSVYVTLDNEIISTKEAKSNESVMEINTDASVDVDHAHALTDVEESNKKSDKPMKQTINQIIEMMNILKDTLYDVPSQQALQIAKDKLYLIQQDLNTVCKHEEGIRVQKPDVSLKLKRKLPKSFVCDKLPQKYPKTNRFICRLGSDVNLQTTVLKTAVNVKKPIQILPCNAVTGKRITDTAFHTLSQYSNYYLWKCIYLLNKN